jgi:hypothetical protein
MLILMAKGYTITRGRLSQSGAIKIAVFMTAFVIVYAILFIYEGFVSKTVLTASNFTFNFLVFQFWGKTRQSKMCEPVHTRWVGMNIIYREL